MDRVLLVARNVFRSVLHGRLIYLWFVGIALMFPHLREAFSKEKTRAAIDSAPCRVREEMRRPRRQRDETAFNLCLRTGKHLEIADTQPDRRSDDGGEQRRHVLHLNGEGEVLVRNNTGG